MPVTQQQANAKEALDKAISDFYDSMSPTPEERNEAQNWYIEDVEVNGATDIQVANYTYYKRSGTL